jgi:hypothetical protein
MTQLRHDFPVPPRSARDVEATSFAWRHALGVPDQWAPNIVDLLESVLPKFIPDFALVVLSNHEMGDAEAYTEFDPPQIAVRASVYSGAREGDGRSRWTLAHELGHLVMHAGFAKNRLAVSNTIIASQPRLKAFQSAEWQADKFAAYFLAPEHVVRQFSTPEELRESCLLSARSAQICFDEVGHRRGARNMPDCVQRLIRDLGSN